MGKAQSKDEEYTEDFQEAKRQIEERGVTGAQAMMRETLIGWKDIKIKIGVTGNSGVGKSSFINAIRGIDDDGGSDDDENDDDKSGARAAKTGCTETTLEPASYIYPENPNITLMDLPGIGTPAYPDLDIYCERVGLETYDTFLILTATRFMNPELELAQKIKSMGKSFFLIRTKIDDDKRNEERNKKPDFEGMLRRIRAYLYKNVKDLGIHEDEIFLISNHKRDKWEFNRLVEAILAKLPDHQKEALTLTLKVLSKDIVKRKVEILRSQLSMASMVLHAAMLALEFSAVKVVTTLTMPLTSVLGIMPFTTGSAHVILDILGRQTTFFRSQLGLPEEDSDEFEKMRPEFQERMKKFYLKERKVFLGQGLAIDMFKCVSHDLMQLDLDTLWNTVNRLLDEMEQLSLELLDEAATRTHEKRTGEAEHSET